MRVEPGDYCSCPGVRMWSWDEGFTVTMDRSSQMHAVFWSLLTEFAEIAEQWERNRGLRMTLGPKLVTKGAIC